MQINRKKFLSMFFLAAYLPVVFVSVNAPKNRSKNNKSECRQKKTIHTYPTIKANKKSQENNKYLKGPKKRNFSFPV